MVPSGEIYAASTLLIDTITLLRHSPVALRCSIMWRIRPINVCMHATMCISQCLHLRCNSWAVWITIHATFRPVTPWPDRLLLFHSKAYIRATMSVMQPTMSNAGKNQIDYDIRKSSECLPSSFPKSLKQKKCKRMHNWSFKKGSKRRMTGQEDRTCRTLKVICRY